MSSKNPHANRWVDLCRREAMYVAVFALTCQSVWAQGTNDGAQASIGRQDSTTSTQKASAILPQRSRPPVMAAKLPFRLFRRDNASEIDDTGPDPFVQSGADAQRHLADQLSPQPLDLSQSAQVNPHPQPEHSELPSRPYPWPTPIDASHGQAAGNGVPPNGGPPIAGLTERMGQPETPPWEPAEVNVSARTSARSSEESSSSVADAWPAPQYPLGHVAAVPADFEAPRTNELNQGLRSPALVQQPLATATGPAGPPATTEPPAATVSTGQNSDFARNPNSTTGAAIPARIETAKPNIVNDGTTTHAAFGDIVESTRVLAIVGNETILAGDLWGQINEIFRDKATKEQLEAQREVLLRQSLPGSIDTKLIYLDFLRSLPPDKLNEVLPQIEKRVSDVFAEQELDKLIEKAGVATAADLDAHLRQLGSSLDKQRRLFMEKNLAREMVGRNVDVSRDVTHEEMLRYYREHAADYDYPARARWRQLMTRFDRFGSTGEAWAALAKMGNEVMRGAPFDSVARRSSQCPRAADGGTYDWTTKGSLVSEKLDQAIFALPPRKMSRFVEDDDGFHIVEVLERQPAGRIPFSDAQDEIAETIREQQFAQQLQAYIARLRRQTYVWTAFDGEVARPAHDVAAPPADTRLR